MPDSTSVSANHRKQSQQITCRTHAQISSPAVLSIETKSHIKAYGHPTQADVLLDCVILIVRYKGSPTIKSLTPFLSNP